MSRSSEPAFGHTFAFGAPPLSYCATPVLACQYRLERLIGAGGMGAVYEARDLPLDRAVAVKVMHPHLFADARGRERCLRELTRQAGFYHPNLVPAYNGGECPVFGVFIVMPHVSGTNLRAQLAALRGPFALDRALGVLCGVASGLHYLHLNGVLHRDLKPSNVLLPACAAHGQPAAQLCDFGIAHAFGGETRLTAPGFVVGSPGYMSPEQAAGAPGLDARSDLYSFGVLAHELLTGRHPFAGGATGAPPSVCAARPEVPPELARELTALLRPDVSGRPKCAAALAAQLAEWRAAV